MDDVRFITCEGCGGDGGDMRGHPNDPHPRDVGACQWCNGTGVEEIQVEPIETCPDCGAVVSGDGISIDETACFRCQG